jgi:hypothetical protein
LFLYLSVIFIAFAINCSKNTAQIKTDDPKPVIENEDKCISGDCVNGWGTKIYKNGGKYVGEFKNSIENGSANYTNPQGEVYAGEYVNGKKEGYGTLYGKDKKIIYFGTWKNDAKLD